MNIKTILSFPQIYGLWQRLIGDNKLRKIYCREYLNVKDADRVLDIGCGSANMLEYLPENIDYVGFDDSLSYIKAAEKRFSKDNYSFICQSINFAQDFEEKFDVIMANGVLHHLSDIEAENLIYFVSRNLKKGGRFLTLDGCYVPNQSAFKKWILKNDRGRFVRTKDKYFALFSNHFNDINVSVRDDLYNIPYTIIIFECS